MNLKILRSMSCEEAAEISTRNESRESTWQEKLQLRLHLFFCRACHKYHDDNRKLSHLLRRARLSFCSEREKEILRQKIANGYHERRQYRDRNQSSGMDSTQNDA